MSLDDLYREVILDHYRNPRRRGSLEHPDAHAEGQNPLCGDEISLDVALDGDRVADVRILGRGCSISQASASMMAEAVAGKTLAEIVDLTHRFKAMMEIEEGDPGIDETRPGAALGDLEALARRAPVPGAHQVRRPALGHTGRGAGRPPPHLSGRRQRPGAYRPRRKSSPDGSAVSRTIASYPPASNSAARPMSPDRMMRPAAMTCTRSTVM